GMTALQHLLASPPDLILLDLGLPDISGFKALRMMRAVSSVPVVVVTARDDETDIIRVLDAGRTTTWSSRSARDRSRPGFARCFGGRPKMPRPAPPCARSAASGLTWGGTRPRGTTRRWP